MVEEVPEQVEDGADGCYARSKVEEVLTGVETAAYSCYAQLKAFADLMLARCFRRQSYSHRLSLDVLIRPISSSMGKLEKGYPRMELQVNPAEEFYPGLSVDAGCFHLDHSCHLPEGQGAYYYSDLYFFLLDLLAVFLARIVQVACPDHCCDIDRHTDRIFAALGFCRTALVADYDNPAVVVPDNSRHRIVHTGHKYSHATDSLDH